MKPRSAARSLAPLLILLAALQTSAQNNPQTIALGRTRMQIVWFAPNIVRIRITPEKTFSDRPSLSVVASPADVAVTRRESKSALELATKEMTITLSKGNGRLEFRDPKGRFLLAQEPNAASFVGVMDREGYRVKQLFEISAQEGLYGLGQMEDPVVNYRGQDLLLTQANRTAINPFLASTRGYGILWDNYSRTRFSDTKAGACFSSEVSDEIDYYVVYGPLLDRVVAGYRFLTGKAPLFGRWAYGYWQSKERYKSSQELIAIAREYRDRRIPLDNIVQDWAYWGGNDQFSSMRWDSSAYPDPLALSDTLHQYHTHLMVSIWPAFGISTAIYKEMDAKGLLYSEPHWNGGKVYDAYSPSARDIYWRYVKEGLFNAGVDAYWMDATEPEFRCTDDRYITEISLKEAGRNELGSFARYLTPYSLMTTRAIYENHRHATEKKRVFILTRSSFAGQQRYGAVTWSGDTFGTWDALRVQIAAGINFSMSGVPYWTHDIGGFITDIHYPGGLGDEAYKELYVRWFQFGTFCPIFRAHGTTIPREIWRFGEQGDWAYDALVASDKLRYRLLPYIYATAWKVTNDDYSFIRGLPMAFPTDHAVYSINDQYLFGAALMVCPVTRPFLHLPTYRGVDITPGHFYSADGSEHGLELRIYRGTAFDSVLLVRKTDASQIGWSGCLPAQLDTSYSLRLNGSLKTDFSGRHTFFIITDGGVRLWVRDSLLIDSPDNDHRMTFAASIDLAGRRKYPLRLEHRQFKPNAALMKINWVEPDPNPPAPGTRDIYLPAGRAWCDFWTGKWKEGGAHIRAEAPIGHLPLYVPAGSILPLGPAIQYAEESTDAPTEIRVYAGQDADFQLYDDEGDTYSYERGAYSLINLHWDDHHRILSFGRAKGSYPGGLSSRRFSVTIVRARHGAGSEETAEPDARVEYRGEAISVKF